MTRTMDDAAGARALPPPSALCVLPCWVIAVRPTAAVKAFIGVPVPGTAESRPCRGRHLWPTYPDDGIRLIKIPSLDLFAAPNHVTALRWKHFRSAPDLFEYFSMLTGGFPEPFTFGQRLKAHFLAQGNPYDVVHDNQTLALGCSRSSAGAYPVDHDSPPHPAGPRPGPRSAKGLEGPAPCAALAPFSTHAGASRSPAEAPGHGLRGVPGRHRRELMSPARIKVVHNGVDGARWAPLPELPELQTRSSPWPARTNPEGADRALEARHAAEELSRAHAPGDRQAQPRRPHGGAAPGRRG